MKKKRNFYPVFVVIVFFLFIFLHQTDKLLIGSLQIPISGAFHLNDLQWGLVNSGALIVGTILYPLWGYLYDRYARQAAGAGLAHLGLDDLAEFVGADVPAVPCHACLHRH